MNTRKMKMVVKIEVEVEVELLVAEDSVMDTAGGNENMRRIMEAVRRTPAEVTLTQQCVCGEYHYMSPDSATGFTEAILIGTGEFAGPLKAATPQPNAPSSKATQ